MRFARHSILPIALLAASAILPSCNTIDDESLPNMPVSINLSTPELWNTYGVSGFGEYRTFVRALGQPRNFPYSSTTTTGFGGLLLVSGFNPFTLEAAVPLAFDLACPVERDQNVRVSMQSDGPLPEAVCPKCGSHFDVVQRGGAPTQGPALEFKRPKGMTRYECYQTNYGGYIIAN